MTLYSELAVTTHVKTIRKNSGSYCQLSRPTTSLTKSMAMCIAFRWSVMLHASETWPLTKINLQSSDRAIIRQICSIKPEDVATVRSSELLAKLEDYDLILRERKLCWFGHVECSSGAVGTACDIQAGAREDQDDILESDGE